MSIDIPSNQVSRETEQFAELVQRGETKRKPLKPGKRYGIIALIVSAEFRPLQGCRRRQ